MRPKSTTKTPVNKKTVETRFGQLQVPETPTVPQKPDGLMPGMARRPRKVTPK